LIPIVNIPGKQIKIGDQLLLYYGDAYFSLKQNLKPLSNNNNNNNNNNNDTNYSTTPILDFSNVSEKNPTKLKIISNNNNNNSKIYNNNSNNNEIDRTNILEFISSNSIPKECYHEFCSVFGDGMSPNVLEDQRKYFEIKPFAQILKGLLTLTTDPRTDQTNFKLCEISILLILNNETSGMYIKNLKLISETEEALENFIEFAQTFPLSCIHLFWCCNNEQSVQKKFVKEMQKYKSKINVKCFSAGLYYGQEIVSSNINSFIILLAQC
jgi:hypothetical protein